MPMDNFTQPVTLTGKLVQLEPLSLDHLEDLKEACMDGEVWKLWYTFIPGPKEMETEIKRRLAEQEKGEMLPFATRRLSDGKIIGMTSIYNINRDVPRLEIGYTWNAKSARGTGTNIESKLLLLNHAFGDLRCTAVRFTTHKFNQQSRRAIEALGASLDGILRHDMRMPDGSLRDTACYSIVRDEWTAAKNHITARLAKYL